MATKYLIVALCIAMQTGVDAGNSVAWRKSARVGTIKLYEAKNRLFSSINRTWARGLRNCFRRRFLPGNMSGKSDAHPVRNQTASRPGESSFLFNALNTIKAVIRRDSEQAASWCSIFPLFSAKT